LRLSGVHSWGEREVQEMEMVGKRERRTRRKGERSKPVNVVIQGQRSA